MSSVSTCFKLSRYWKKILHLKKKHENIAFTDFVNVNVSLNFHSYEEN